MASPNNRYRRRGVPAVVAILLALLALMVGLLLGYVLRDRLGPNELANRLLTGAGTDEDGLPVEPLDAETAAGLLSGDLEIAPLSEADDPQRDAEAELRAVPEEPVVVAEYDGGEILSSEVIDAYNEAMDAYLLENFSVPENAEGLLEETLRELADERIALVEAEAQGLTTLTEADEAAIQAEAEARFAARVAELAPENADENARDVAARRLSEGEGITVESIAAQLREDYWRTKLRDQVTAEVVVTDEVLQEAYDTRLEAQKALFAASTDEYDYARLTGEPILYNPEGYRVVRQILFAPEGEARAQCVALVEEREALDPAGDAARIAEIDAALAEIYAPLEAKAEAARERLAAGEDFDALRLELSDVGAGEPADCYVGPNTQRWSADFTAAAMGLENFGDVSAPVRSVSGVHLIEYVGDVPAGEVSLDSVRGELAEVLLTELREQAYSQQLDAWKESLHLTLYPDRL